MIIIDGRQSELPIENFANLEEILVSLTKNCSDEQRIITDVFLNDEHFSEIYPHQAEDIEQAEIKRVEICSMPLGEMALNISEELLTVTRMMSGGSRQVAHLFRQGDDNEALELFQDLLDVTRDFMSMVGVLRSEFVDVSDAAFIALVERVSALLGEMSEVLENEDWIMLADLLEFEFHPVCEEWHGSIQSMREQIRSSIAA